MLDVETGLAPLVERQAEFKRFLMRRTRSDDDAEDVFQEALLKATGKLHTLRDSSAIVPWFYRILRNTLSDHRARLAARQAALAEVSRATGPPPMPPYERPGCACSIAMLDALPPPYAALLRCVDVEQEPVERFAEREGITANNATVRLHRARKALRARLAAFCGTTSPEACLSCSCATGEPASAPAV